MNLLEQKIGTYWNKYKTETDAVILEHKVIDCKYKLISILSSISVFCLHLLQVSPRYAKSSLNDRRVPKSEAIFRDNHEFNNSEIITNLHLHSAKTLQTYL